MKRAPTIVLTVLALAFPLAAEDPKPASATTTSAEAQAEQPDSPLVAAAKRANRRGKKPKNLITNENLKKSGANAHVTTTASQPPLKVPKPPAAPAPTTQKAAEGQQAKSAEQVAAEKKKAEEARAAAGMAAEEGLYESVDHDPAQAEREHQDANQQKPPQF